ncbi:MAG: hypothetical protein EXS17_03535 [Phycisphaerales bacterium]|nr:hypothetical protein [Phycisphaerales bacterium]
MRKQSFIFASCLTAGCVALSVVLGLPGCTSTMTYPEFPGAPKADPSLQPMPNLMGDALKFAHQNIAPATEIVYNLPPTTPVQVWRLVGKRIGVGRPMVSTDTSAWTVRQVRLSGGKAEVDVVYPTAAQPSGIMQLATVHFTGSAGQTFYPTILQMWLVPTDAPACTTPQAIIDGSKPAQ